MFIPMRIAGTERAQDIGKPETIDINCPSYHDTLKKPDSQVRVLGRGSYWQCSLLFSLTLSP